MSLYALQESQASSQFFWSKALSKQTVLVKNRSSTRSAHKDLRGAWPWRSESLGPKLVLPLHIMDQLLLSRRQTRPIQAPPIGSGLKLILPHSRFLGVDSRKGVQYLIHCAALPGLLMARSDQSSSYLHQINRHARGIKQAPVTINVGHDRNITDQKLAR